MSAKIYIAFVVVSISTMFPNNAFMNAHEYFYYKLRNVTDDHENNTNVWFLKNLAADEIPTPLQADFEAYLTVYGGLACVLGSVLNVCSTNFISNVFRVICGHILVIIVFVPTILLTFFNFDEAQNLFFNLSMGLFSIACFGSLGMMAGGVLGLSATFPPKYTQAVMVGQSFSGVLAAVMSVFCQAVTPNVIVNGQIYFSFSLFMTFVSLVAYYYLISIEPPVEVEDEAEQSLLDDNNDLHNLHIDELHIEAQASHFPPIDADVVVEETMLQRYSEVVKKSGIDLITISVVLLITLATYPGLTSLVRSTSRNHTWNAYFSDVASFLLFNIGDLIGRSSANSFRLPRKWLLSIACLRVVLIPLIVICNVIPRYHTHVLLPYDGVFILLVIVLAVSHGFCITNATVGATLSIEKESRELAGSITSLIGVTAAMIGGIVGVFVIKIV